MAKDDDLLRRLDGQEKSGGVDEALLRRLEEGQGLPTNVSQRYLELGRRLLGDDMPTILGEAVRARFERMMGRDLSGVRLHTGERAQRAAEAMGARAFALGESDIFFGRGAYSPHSREGVGLLAHELAHIVQAGAPGGSQLGFSGRRGGGGEEGAERAEGMVLAEEDGPSPGGTAEAPAGEGSAEKASGDKPKWQDSEAVAWEAERHLLESFRKRLERNGERGAFFRY